MHRSSRRSPSIVMALGLPGALTAAASEEETCRIPRNDPIVVSVEEGESKVLRFGADCSPRIARERDDGTSAADSEYGHERISLDGDFVDGDVVVARPPDELSQCNAKSTHHDIVHLRLTEARVYARWYWDGTRVTGRDSAGTNATWLRDWTLTEGPRAFWYRAVSSRYRQVEGWAAFDLARIGGFPHEHRAIVTVTGSGGCSADNYFSGTICRSCHVHFAVYKG